MQHLQLTAHVHKIRLKNKRTTSAKTAGETHKRVYYYFTKEDLPRKSFPSNHLLLYIILHTYISFIFFPQHYNCYFIEQVTQLNFC